MKYLVAEECWQYNDENYYHEGGYQIASPLFNTREEAEKYIEDNKKKYCIQAPQWDEEEETYVDKIINPLIIIEIEEK